MKQKIGNFFKKIREYNRIASIEEIGRRYFAMNSFDGILTILGVLIGSYIAKVQESKIIIVTGIGVSIGMGLSGIWGTFLTEEAERKKKLKELGRATLSNLSNTKIARAERAAIIIISIINGLSPFFAAFFTITPFFFVSLIGISTAYLLSLIFSFILLLALGAFLGHISKENIFLSGLKMLFAGAICVLIIMAIGSSV